MRNIGAVILAAGGSLRLGQPKQLLNFRGETLVAHAVRVVEETHCVPVVVVVGESANAIQEQLRETSAVTVENPDWQRGLGTSIRRGLEHLLESAPATDAVILLACDQPLVDASTIAALIAEQDQTRKAIVASNYANTLGVPALFDRSYFKELLALPDDSGAKSLINAWPGEVASIVFENGAIDIDTPADFERLR
jgi:molybdenum cofactor cytidylyltransferase